MAIYYAATGIIAGTSTAGGMNIASIGNPSGSTINVRMLRAFVRGVPGALASAGPFLYHLARTTAAPTGGTTLTAATQITTNAAAQAVVRSSPTATATGGDFWVETGGSALSLIGVSQPSTDEVLKDVGEYDITLQPNEAILFHTDGASSNWSHWALFVWSEN